MEDCWTVVACDRAPEGFYIHSARIEVAPPVSLDAKSLGARVLDMLSQSTSATFDIAQVKATQAKLLRAIGVRSWKQAMEKRIACISVERKDTTVIVVPTRNGGFSGKDSGFHELTNKSQRTALNAESLGVALWQARELCE